MIPIGRIRTKEIKKLAREFLDKNSSAFTPKFEDNKKSLTNVQEKKTRNKIAGYITRVKKRETA